MLNKNFVTNIINRVNIYNESIEKLFNKFVIETAETNIYRDENYVLLGTVLHVVTCLQIAENNPCINYECQDKLITCNPCCSLDNFNLIHVASLKLSGSSVIRIL